MSYDETCEHGRWRGYDTPCPECEAEYAALRARVRAGEEPCPICGGGYRHRDYLAAMHTLAMATPTGGMDASGGEDLLTRVEWVVGEAARLREQLRSLTNAWVHVGALIVQMPTSTECHHHRNGHYVIDTESDHRELVMREWCRLEHERRAKAAGRRG